MDQKLQKLLYSTGVFQHYQGYDYLIRCVHLVLEDPERLHHIYKEVYLTVAIEFKKDVRSVEKSLRTVRNVFVKNGGTELLVEMGISGFMKKDKPQLKEMIEVFAYYLQKQEEQEKKAIEA